MKVILLVLTLFQIPIQHFSGGLGPADQPADPGGNLPLLGGLGEETVAGDQDTQSGSGQSHSQPAGGRPLGDETQQQLDLLLAELHPGDPSEGREEPQQPQTVPHRRYVQSLARTEGQDLSEPPTELLPQRGEGGAFPLSRPSHPETHPVLHCLVSPQQEAGQPGY